MGWSLIVLEQTEVCERILMVSRARLELKKLDNGSTAPSQGSELREDYARLRSALWREWATRTFPAPTDFTPWFEYSNGMSNMTNILSFPCDFGRVVTPR